MSRAGAGRTGGPLLGRASLNAQGAGASFSCNFTDAKVDKETGKVDILSFTAVQDAGRAIHPSYVEGQMQGGAVQGIGWALNEEYIYNDDGVMENAGFLDYRVPVASDMPMIDTHNRRTHRPYGCNPADVLHAEPVSLDLHGSRVDVRNHAVSLLRQDCLERPRLPGVQQWRWGRRGLYEPQRMRLKRR